MQALLQAGADVHKSEDDDITPLYMASQNDHVPVVQARLQAGPMWTRLWMVASLLCT